MKHYTPTTMAKIKKTEHNKHGKNIKQLEFSFTGGNVTRYRLFGKQFYILLKFDHIATI